MVGIALRGSRVLGGIVCPLAPLLFTSQKGSGAGDVVSTEFFSVGKVILIIVVVVGYFAISALAGRRRWK